MSQAPSVGRIVHYVSYGTPGGEYRSECRAAIITAVQPEGEQYADCTPLTRTDLAVLNPTGFFFNQGCEHDEDLHVGGTWHWPERDDTAPEATARPAAIGYSQEHIEPIARAFHEIYERLAPEHGYKTREASAVPWAEVPANNKSLMIAVVASLVAEGRIIPGDSE